MAFFERKVHNYDLYSGHAWYVPGIKGMFGFIGWFLLGALLATLIEFILMMFLPQQAIVDYGMIVLYPVQFLPAMVYAANQSRRNMVFDAGYALDNKHFSPYSFVLLIIVTVIMTFASMFAFDLPNYWNMQLTQKSSVLSELYDMFTELMKQLTGGPFWSSFLVVAIFAPVFEEWLCRGMVLRGLLTKMKPVWAIVISALFFAVIHANPWQALNAFLIGLMMGYVYYKTGSLILTMIIHFVNNGTAVVMENISYFRDMDDNVQWIDILGKQNYTIVILVSCIILAACLYVFSRVKLEHPWGNIDRFPSADEVAAAEAADEKPAIEE